MNEPRVTGLRSAEFSVPDLAGTKKFYEECWGLESVADEDGAVYLRATGSEHHILVLREGVEKRLQRINLAASDKAAVEGLHENAKGLGADVDTPAAILEPGGGYGFVFRDLDGRDYRISSDVAQHEAKPMEADKPFKISHVVQNSSDRMAQSDHFIDMLGFKLSDRTGYMDFIRCSSDHHSIAWTEIKRPTMNHCAFEVPSHDALMRGSGRMQRSGFPVEWGVGRHGPGNNVFAYFIDPNGYVIEYTAEVEQVDDSYKVGMPDDWIRPADWNGDSWGFAGPASDRMRQATHG